MKNKKQTKTNSRMNSLAVTKELNKNRGKFRWDC